MDISTLTWITPRLNFFETLKTVVSRWINRKIITKAVFYWKQFTLNQVFIKKQWLILSLAQYTIAKNNLWVQLRFISLFNFCQKFYTKSIFSYIIFYNRFIIVQKLYKYRHINNNLKEAIDMHSMYPQLS